jgi:hypothetical protein
MVHIHFQTMRQKYARHPSNGIVFIDQRQIFHVKKLETLGASTFTEEEWF